MKINANLIRPGNILEHNNRQWAVLKIQIVQPGKGGAFIQVEMRDVRSGTKTNERWRTADTVEKLQVEEKECTYLFGDEEGLTLAERIDRRVDRLPGLDGLGLMRGAVGTAA